MKSLNYAPLKMAQPSPTVSFCAAVEEWKVMADGAGRCMTEQSVQENI